MQEDETNTDVTDVAGGTRQHRKLMLNTLPLDETSEQTIDTSKNTRSTRSSRLRGPSRNTVNYNEEKVLTAAFLKISRLLKSSSIYRYNVKFDSTIVFINFSLMNT